ncbi:hypothetical protein A6U87_23055 [Rhizobium sp. AC44/96]|jgi:hypothetical protein|nr:hypothetical protein A6U87_23055 [Rhizobium sp. AC44/96]
MIGTTQMAGFPQEPSPDDPIAIEPEIISIETAAVACNCIRRPQHRTAKLRSRYFEIEDFL